MTSLLLRATPTAHLYMANTWMTIWLYCNNVINPLIYYHRMPDFRHGFRRLVPCCPRAEAEGEPGTETEGEPGPCASTVTQTMSLSQQPGGPIP